MDNGVKTTSGGSPKRSTAFIAFIVIIIILIIAGIAVGIYYATRPDSDSSTNNNVPTTPTIPTGSNLVNQPPTTSNINTTNQPTANNLPPSTTTSNLPPSTSTNPPNLTAPNVLPPPPPPSNPLQSKTPPISLQQLALNVAPIAQSALTGATFEENIYPWASIPFTSRGGSILLLLSCSTFALQTGIRTLTTIINPGNIEIPIKFYFNATLTHKTIPSMFIIPILKAGNYNINIRMDYSGTTILTTADRYDTLTIAMLETTTENNNRVEFIPTLQNATPTGTRGGSNIQLFGGESAVVRTSKPNIFLLSSFTAYTQPGGTQARFIMLFDGKPIADPTGLVSNNNLSTNIGSSTGTTITNKTFAESSFTFNLQQQQINYISPLNIPVPETINVPEHNTVPNIYALVNTDTLVDNVHTVSIISPQNTTFVDSGDFCNISSIAYSTDANIIVTQLLNNERGVAQTSTPWSARYTSQGGTALILCSLSCYNTSSTFISKVSLLMDGSRVLGTTTFLAGSVHRTMPAMFIVIPITAGGHIFTISLDTASGTTVDQNDFINMSILEIIGTNNTTTRTRLYTPYRFKNHNNTMKRLLKNYK